MRTVKNLDNETFIEECEFSFEILRIFRDALQMKVDDDLTSDAPDITSRIEKNQRAADAIGIKDSIDWTAKQIDGQ